MTSPRRLMNELGLAAQKGRGQNFLADPAAAGLIVSRSDLRPEILVLEIGPGLGALTRPLLEAGCRVIAVEVDRGLARFLETQLAPGFPDRLTVIQDDILKVDLPALAGPEQGGLYVVGNLPFQISTPVLLMLLKNRALITGATLTFQRELAERLTAEPGTKLYGRLSVLLGYYARLRRLLEVGPEAFQPRPKVGSTVLGLTFIHSPQPPLKSHHLFERVVAAGFSKRRKTLRNALKSAFPPDRIEAALSAAGIDPARRAETLSVEEFVDLANAMA